MSQIQNIETYTDEQLADEYRESESPAILGELYKRHTQFVFLVSMKYLKEISQSEDMVMHIFEKLFSELKNQNIKNFKAWLHTVTRNECLMKFRKAQSEQKKFQSYKKDEEQIVEFETDLHHSEKRDEDARIDALQKAVQTLKPEQRQCVDLFYLKEKSYNEVADITGFSLKQVKSYIQNGKRNLKNYLEKSGIAVSVITALLSQTF